MARGDSRRSADRPIDQAQLGVVRAGGRASRPRRTGAASRPSTTTEPHAGEGIGATGVLDGASRSSSSRAAVGHLGGDVAAGPTRRGATRAAPSSTPARAAPRARRVPADRTPLGDQHRAGAGEGHQHRGAGQEEAAQGGVAQHRSHADHAPPTSRARRRRGRPARGRRGRQASDDHGPGQQPDGDRDHAGDPWRGCRRGARRPTRSARTWAVPAPWSGLPDPTQSGTNHRTGMLASAAIPHHRIVPARIDAGRSTCARERGRGAAPRPTTSRRAPGGTARPRGAASDSSQSHSRARSGRRPTSGARAPRRPGPIDHGASWPSRTRRRKRGSPSGVSTSRRGSHHAGDRSGQPARQAGHHDDAPAAQRCGRARGRRARRGRRAGRRSAVTSDGQRLPRRAAGGVEGRRGHDLPAPHQPRPRVERRASPGRRATASAARTQQRPDERPAHRPVAPVRCAGAVAALTAVGVREGVHRADDPDAARRRPDASRPLPTTRLCSRRPLASSMLHQLVVAVEGPGQHPAAHTCAAVRPGFGRSHDDHRLRTHEHVDRTARPGRSRTPGRARSVGVAVRGGPGHHRRPPRGTRRPSGWRVGRRPPPGGPACSTRPVAHHHDLVGQRQRLLLVVGHEQGAGPGLARRMAATSSRSGHAQRRRRGRRRARRAARPRGPWPGPGPGATRWRSPPESSWGYDRRPVGQPDQLEALLRPAGTRARRSRRWRRR